MALKKINFFPNGLVQEKPKELPKINFFPNGLVQEQPKPLPKVDMSGAYKLTDKGSGGEQKKARDQALGGIKKTPTGDMSSSTQQYTQDNQTDVPRVSKKDATDISNRFGLKNMGLDKEFEGLTFSEANKKAEDLKKAREGQVSQNTSFSYSPKAISGFKDTFKDLTLRVKDTSNNPFESKDSKVQTKDALIKSYTQNLAKNFSSVEEFNAAQQVPEMQKLLSEYEKIGGSRNDIASNITKTGLNVVSETPNRDGSYTVTYSDGTQDVRRYSQNADGTYTSNAAQTIDQYLGSRGTPEEKQAMQELIPEYNIQQDKIALEQSIPDQYKKYYFGSEDETGFFDQQKKLAEEKIKNLEEKAKDEKRNLKEDANLLIEKNQWEQQKDEAEIEQNRLVAKNYTTGLLAKLGALKTTGAAIEGIANLDQKYQKEIKDTQMAYNFANKEIEVKLNKGIDDIENTLAESVWTVKNDLSKDQEDVWKDIFKMQTEASRKTLDIIDKFAGEFRTTKEKYRKERIAAAKKYADEFASTISDVDISKFKEGDFVFKTNAKGKRVEGGILTPEGKVQDVRAYLEETKGADGYVNSRALENAFNAYIKSGGNREDFLKIVQVNQYANPADPTLPSFLKFGSTSRAEANVSDEDFFGEIK